MKKNFDKCLEIILQHEGGYVDHPEDPGGATNMGITKATYEQWVGHKVDKETIKNLHPEVVASIYKQKYWDTVRGDELPSGVDLSVFDWGVNAGPARAAKGLQRVCMVNRDGVIGPITLKAAYDQPAEDIIRQLHYHRQQFYLSLKTFRTFGRGWTRRNKETLEAALMMARAV